MNEEPMSIFGDGSQTRSFCFVDDLIDGMLAMMDSRDGFTGPVNLGNPHEFTIRQLAELVVAGTNSNSTIEQAKALPEDDPLQRQPDISLAKAELDWEPGIELASGLEKTIRYFDSIDLDHFRAPTPNY